MQIYNVIPAKAGIQALDTFQEFYHSGLDTSFRGNDIWALFRIILSILLAVISAPSLVAAQQVHITGTVCERGTSDAIPGASLAIMGTSRGAKANAEGKFRLELDSGKSYKIRVTAIGYKPDTLAIAFAADTSRRILLTSAPIGGAMITVSADATRNAARKIMHKVIDTKDAWQSQIKDYRFNVYSRLNFKEKKDTSSTVLGVLESVANGYWRRDKGYAERITARKQTANMPADVNQIALFDIDNFYNDRLDFADYSVVSPVAHDAFDRYDYDLIGEGELNGSSVYKISVEPLSDLFPSFQGTLWIDKADYTIVYLDLSPDDAIKIGPIKDIKIQQTFSFVENRYWMPSEIGFACNLKLEMPFIPAFSFEQNATLEDYTINGGLPDSLFVKEHSVAESADSVDSLHWASLRTIPLAKDEDSAYHKYDSIAKIPPEPRSFSPTGLLFSLIPGLDVYQYNRVEGSHFELGTSFKFSDKWPLTVSGKGAYGVSDNRFKYSIGLTQGITYETRRQMSASLSTNGVSFNGIQDVQSVTSDFSARVYDNYVPLGNAYDPIVNTITSLFLHNDYPNYFRARGFEVDYDLNPKSIFSAQIHFKNEDESSLQNVTSYSLLDKQDTFRINPPINDGRLHEIGAWLAVSPDLGNWNGSASINLNYSTPGIGSQFNYFTGALDLTLEGKMGGWGKGWFNAKYSDLLNGALPAQSLFFFEARDAVIAPHGVFRTMYPFEFQGDRAWSIMYEQNFYDLPTRLIGINMPIDLHWFGFANIAGASLSDKTNAFQPVSTETLGTSPYAEAGFGIGNILNILRFDASWRLTYRVQHNFFVTGTMAFSF